MPFATPRVRSYFGAELEQVNDEGIARLVGQREDFDLEFKSALYERSDDGKRELAKDVAALANFRGGVIVIGIAEADGVATELTPVEIAEGEELRIRSVVTERVVPYLEIEVRRIAASGGAVGSILVAVPASVDSPHAIRNGESLRFPIRDGNRCRYLAEAEIASRYRQRFSDAADRDRRVEEVAGRGAEQLRGGEVWMTFSVVPLRAGSLRFDTASRAEVERAFQDSLRRLLPPGSRFGQQFRAETAIQMVQMTDSMTHGDGPHRAVAQLYADGSSFLAAAIPWWNPWNQSGSNHNVADQSIAFALIGIVELAARHAVAVGAAGDAIALIRLQIPQLEDGAFVRVQTMSDAFPPVMGWEPLRYPEEGIRYTLPLASVANSAIELIAACYEPLADIDAAYGEPDARCVTRDGAVTSLLTTGTQGELQRWAEQRGLEVR